MTTFDASRRTMTSPWASSRLRARSSASLSSQLASARSSTRRRRSRNFLCANRGRNASNPIMPHAAPHSAPPTRATNGFSAAANNPHVVASDVASVMQKRAVPCSSEVVARPEAGRSRSPSTRKDSRISCPRSQRAASRGRPGTSLPPFPRMRERSWHLSLCNCLACGEGEIDRRPTGLMRA